MDFISHLPAHKQFFSTKKCRKSMHKRHPSRSKAVYPRQLQSSTEKPVGQSPGILTHPFHI